MVITWDEPKRLSNLSKHGLDFAAFEEGFDFDGAIVAPANDGRFKMIGRLQGELLVAVIVAVLGSEALSLISLRPASQKERELYDGRG